MSDLSSIFQTYKGCRIAVYGLSVETEKILPKLNGLFQVTGLLDGYRESGSIYGYPILSMNQAIREKIEMILVVARPGSCRVIAKRIGALCRERGIALLDVRGRDLCGLQEAVYDLKQVSGITRKALWEKAVHAEAVSFDLFDTLVTRQVLFPSDVYELVDGRLQKQGICIEDFCGKRMESEKTLSKTEAPTLTEIYIYMINTYGIQGITPEELAGMEWETDLMLLTPRREMCGFFRELCDLGKEVYLVSDTYYTEPQIRQLLERFEIQGCKEILASCEYRTGKIQQLFGELKDWLSGKTCLHIGDDLAADVESARKNGIDACQILSGAELLERVGYLGLWDCLDSLSNRIKAGMFTAELFNSPFQFETEGRKLRVRNSHEIGYLFFAPMISDFVLWFDQQTGKDQMENLWFGARDGYLIRKLYEELGKEIPSIYFLISRIAAIRAGVEREEDISYVEEMKFSGSLKEQLAKRFGICLEGKDTGGKLSDHTQEILKKAAVNKANYQTYIGKQKIQPGPIAFFDFVAKGTSQRFLGRLVDHPLKGYYFLRQKALNKDDRRLDIASFYDGEALKGSAIFDNYYILETILTSPMPSLDGFDEKGEPLYAEETRKESDKRCVREAQEGICRYFRTYLRIGEFADLQIDRKMDEIFLMMIHRFAILDEDFLGLTVEDPFFNRMSDLRDLI